MSSAADDQRRAALQAMANELGQERGMDLAVVIAIKGHDLYLGSWAPDTDTVIGFLTLALENIKRQKKTVVQLRSVPKGKG